MSMSANKIDLAAATESDPRWASVVARSAAADGTFYYSVRTTGVYCRPSCAARLARPENVRFHASREEAEAAGFRYHGSSGLEQNVRPMPRSRAASARRRLRALREPDLGLRHGAA